MMYILNRKSSIAVKRYGIGLPILGVDECDDSQLTSLAVSMSNQVVPEVLLPITSTASSFFNGEKPYSFKIR